MLKLVSVALLLLLAVALAQKADRKEITNSAGMRLAPIEAGSLSMGALDGDFDEKPVHRVRIGKPFYMSTTEVTNSPYGRFDPGHRKLRGKLGFSKGDDEGDTRGT